MLPADVILNTRRAFNTSPTSATGSPDLGVRRTLSRAVNSAIALSSRAALRAGTPLVRAPFFNPSISA